VNGDNLRLRGRPLAGLLAAVSLLSVLAVSLSGRLLDTAFSSEESTTVLSPTSVQWVLDDGFPVWVTTEAGSVGQGLASLGVTLREGDVVDPPLWWPLSPGLRVVVRRAKDVQLIIGGQAGHLRTQAATVGELLAQQMVSLGPQDEVQPSPAAALEDGAVVRVIRVKVGEETEERRLPRPVEYRDDPSLSPAHSYVASWGSDGLVRRRYEVVYKDGQLWERRLVDEEVVPPQPMLIVRGVGGPPAGECEGIPYKRAITVWATWYQPGKGGGYITATGVPVTKGIVAVDPAVIPLGTRMCIPGYGMAVAADTGGGVRGYSIDLAYPEGVVPDWRTGFVTIYILD